MNVGEKIKKIRKMAGMTQEELAEKMNVSRQTISKWEKEISSPDLDSAIALCELFEISLDDLMKGEQSVREEKISLQDMIKINQRNQKQTVLLISGLFFLMIGALATLFIVAIESSTNSIEYMLYRYIVTGQYSSAPIDYGRLMAPAILLIAIGVILSMVYTIEKWKGKKRDDS
ncbi:MAG: helix-turn-helix transcriptional regulator [Lachnospiraceae bacterium]|nr:helix-turn-helix transcriptional regulator [Lachnospiraceae bacterium]MCI9132787.1 helix-turn-helix transcriptional regulator [Lachnospiraceae bacterium]